MEKKKSTTKSNKKGTNVTNKAATKKDNSTKVVTKKEAPKVKSETTKKVEPIAKETVKAEVPKTTAKKVEEVNMAKPVNTKPITNDDEFSGNEIRKLLIIIGAVCAVMLSFYFITEFVIKNKKEKDTTDTPQTETVIQYEEILMGELFNKGKDEYYVLAYVKDEPYMNLYNDYIKTYNAKDEHKKFYKVDLSNDFNKGYLADESYLSGSDITKIKVKGTTLIKVIDGKIVNVYQSMDEISGKFERLIG